MDTQNSNRFLKLKDVQDLLGVSRTTLWRWQAEHGLKVVRVGDVVRVRESDLQAFLERHESNPLPDAVAQGGECVNLPPAR
jgi:excisionase family DNA binding protein